MSKLDNVSEASMEPIVRRPESENERMSRSFRYGFVVGVLAGIQMAAMAYCLGNLVMLAFETPRVHPSPKAVQQRKDENRSIPKKEYEEWLEEHRRSQDGPRIGNGG